jgi:DNA-directed RNA polymerase sigma subunit (sigma70/sigma32)
VIELRFGIAGEERSAEATAEALGVSTEEAAALEHKALERLRRLGSLATPRAAA